MIAIAIQIIQLVGLTFIHHRLMKVVQHFN